MVRYAIAAVVIVFGMTAAAETIPTEPTALQLADSALAQVEMTHDQVRFDYDEMATYGGDKYRRRYFTMLHKNPFKLPKYGELHMRMLTSHVTNLPWLLFDAGKKLDHPIRRWLVEDHLAKYIQPPDSLPRPSIMRGQGVLTERKHASLRRSIDLIFAVADDDEHLAGHHVQVDSLDDVQGSKVLV